MIVATSGGFDPLHVGHLRLLQEAKKLGDSLCVILNTDEFLMRKKGFIFMPLKERAEILLGLRCVDRVEISIDEDQTVCKTLEKIKPDIFAKGGDSTEFNVPEKAICEKYGIKLVFGIGGGKIQSSSWLTKAYN
jgi:D-beta-D-heptose 7-phosphate kinase/D-beta-D-heptose 1-phosphate adenosyltransferase